MTKENVATNSDQVETKVENTKQETVQTPKRRGRGINNSTRNTTRLKYDNRDASMANGLFLGMVHEIKLSNVTIGDETKGLTSFNGLEVPVVKIVFKSPKEEESKKRFVEKTFMPVESNVDTIIDGKDEWKVTSMFEFMKHILMVIVTNGKDLTEEMEDLLTLPFEDSDENGNFIQLEPETIIEGYRYVFQNFVNIINNEGNPYFIKNNKHVVYWIKLIRSYKSKTGWKNNVKSGELSFPTYIGEGCIEAFKTGVEPTLMINNLKERLIAVPDAPKQTKPNMFGGQNVGPVGSGVTMPNIQSQITDFNSQPIEGAPNFGDVADDLPF